ncbi:MAG TPA: FAD-binding and (Fe-S)-binding domain-containing protein, partial [Actinomycetes bacterium]|nr:FAD-binding and (Fe-S)-binding domain-containing protein [Actinomycetes bacterium]
MEKTGSPMMAATAKPRRNVTTRPPQALAAPVDGRRLATELAANLRGEVRFDPGSRALYAKDYSVYRHLPIGVVVPRDVDDVVATVELCRRHGAPVLARGCGTSPNGQCCNVAVVLDCSKYLRRIVALDPERRVARVQPGVVCDQLRTAAERHQLTFGPDPATHAYNTLGGMIGNNSCGTHSVMAGQTVDNIHELEVLTYDGLRLRVGPTSEEELERTIAQGGRRGEIYARLRDLRDRYGELVRQRYPRIPRRCSGYNLDQLLPERGFHVARALVGTESTCVTLLEATTRLVASPQHRRTVALGYPDRFRAGDHVPEVMAHGPIGLEGFDTTLTENMQASGALAVERSALPPGQAWLLVEFGADSEQEAAERASAAARELEAGGGPLSVKLCDAGEQLAVWAVRQAGVDYSNVPGVLETEGTWEDAAVPPERLGDYLRDFDRLLDRFGYRCVYYGHFGQGCVHTRIDFDLKTAAGLKSFRSFLEQAADLVVGYGGSIAGEYGEGQRGELLPRMFGQELVQAFREFKAIWDPDGRMNPGKVVDPYPLDRHLRFGAGYDPPQPATHFKFPQDRGSFAVATERCFGIGRCRKTEGGTMCPSYMVTREEMHTTRGRANLLFEMLQADSPLRGWRDQHVKRALDLCLACKACKGECPVQVDIATYKAEFLAHYYQRRLRPRSAYAIGLLPWWARLAGRAPGPANALLQTPALAGALKRLAGVAPERPLPRFAAPPFVAWFAAHQPRHPTGPRVLLWPDTFSNYFRPDTGQAAVEVLEAAGCRVELPPRPLCCGRPLYDYGMLRLAKRLLRQVLEVMAEPLAAGLPLLVLEPSCAAVFRDELGNLFPTDERARRLRQKTLLLSEFLQRQADGWQPPRLDRKALVHGHCHHKAIMKLTDEQQLLARLGLDAEVLDAGCCG